MSIVACQPFGFTADGIPVTRYTMRSPNGMEAEILTYGGVLRRLSVPGKDGFADVVLGHDTLEDYEKDDKFSGAIIGRCANRIAGGAFMLNGKPYALECNDGENHLHGGPHGLHTKVWGARIHGDALWLICDLPAGDGGYPGKLHVEVIYLLGNQGLTMEYKATSDVDTVVNLTNHTYFNLDGHDAGSVMDHTLQLSAEYYTPNLAGGIPTGQVLPVAGTPFDFRTPQALGARAGEDDEQLALCGGYDHNYVVKPLHSPALVPVAALESAKSGRRMECWSTQPGVQLYTGNFLDGRIPGKGGASNAWRTGVCLETQNWPNAVNQPNFPSAVLREGKAYHQKTAYRFSTL